MNLGTKRHVKSKSCHLRSVPFGCFKVCEPYCPSSPLPVAPCSWRQDKKKGKGRQGRSASCGRASYVTMTRPFKVDLDGQDSLRVGNSASASVNALDVNQECADGWRAGQPDCCVSPPAVAAGKSAVRQPEGPAHPADKITPFTRSSSLFPISPPTTTPTAAFPHFPLTC